MCRIFWTNVCAGLTLEEEDALKNAQRLERNSLQSMEKEDLAVIESRELEERRQNIQQWVSQGFLWA